MCVRVCGYLSLSEGVSYFSKAFPAYKDYLPPNRPLSTSRVAEGSESLNN